MIWRVFRAICLGLLAGCASLVPDPRQQRADETAYFQAVEERREPKDFLYLYEDPAYTVAQASADLAEGKGQQAAAQRADRLCRERLKEALRPRVAEALERYGRWFARAERQRESELVERLAAQAARGSLKVWGRFYFAIGKYQIIRCVHRTQIEIDIIGDAIVREQEQGGDEIQGLVRRMERLQARFIYVSKELNFRN